MSWERNNHNHKEQAFCITLKSFSVPFMVKKMFLMLCAMNVLTAASLDEGNNYLKKGEYEQAIGSYQLLIKEGYIGHELFFNLATAYQKQGNVPQAIINFEKALRLKPLDAATKHQLVQLNLKLQDKPVIYDDTGLLAFFNKIQFTLNTDAWAFLSIVMMVLVATVIFVSYQFKQLKFRKLIFMSSILWFLLSGFCVLMARNNYHYRYLLTEGIVVVESLVVYDGSNTSSKIKFSVHEGTKLEINDSTQTMYKVNYSGDGGWILREGIQKIEL